ncbi:Npun_F5749 family FMN-dependent PPOX-type flavoprotein [Chroococcus sp. FPU101]|uniref:Npun_F5749 family FMN-dependent PPOX-type flavoprotein n=1 Tax=Chroococcus sp. FPU101 TaxID=1974212 RepID=UPI001A8E9AB1|nr:Npun_F5749 family FMN-dependent PPOX-type flavoprotein [Chroococcus sp. FPU101]GFE70581.1 Pyridoxamine 5'-phosphate oxidase-related, FMN-binding [Chroococcus sp. FPU101]
MEAEKLALWRAPLARALHLNRSLPQSRYFQLATIRQNGYPANRTVVYRGFRDQTNQIQMISDLRSEKIQQINNSPLAEICWYFSQTREQFRFTGTLTLISADSNLQSIRLQIWQQLSNAARLQFAWPEPKQPRIEAKEAFLPPTPSVNEPLPNFGLLLFDSIEVDHLELRGEPQNRSHYQLDQQHEWSVKSINP